MPVPTEIIRSTRRKAVSIGIRYRNAVPQDKELPGAINDPIRMRDLLVGKFNYHPDDVHILLDDDSGKYDLPTRSNIIAAMKDLVAGAQAGDHLVFHFSGHASQIASDDDDEDDGLDEVIWPMDIVYNDDYSKIKGYIIDNTIKELLVDPLPAGVRLAAILDCCHSGTCMDLPNSFSEDEDMIVSPISPTSRSGIPDIKSAVRVNSKKTLGANLTSGMPHTARGVLCPVAKEVLIHRKVEVKLLPKDESKMADVTSWSACKDEQVELESDEGGALVDAFVATLTKNPVQTHEQLLTNLTKTLVDLVMQANEEDPDASGVPFKSIPQLGSLKRSDHILQTKFVL